MFDTFLYYLILPLVSLSYILVPLTNDARIYIGVEYIADTFYPFPYGFDIAWEIKPIANRVLNWALYKLATLFVSFDNTIFFGMVVKLISLCIIAVVCYYFATKINIRYGFALTFLSFTAISNIVILQAEFWAVLVSLLAVALLLSDSRYCHMLAGILFVVIGLFKGITCLMFIPILCAVYLLNPLSELYYKHLLAGFTAACIAFLLADKFLFTHMLSDMLMSAAIARVGQHSPIDYFMSMNFYIVAALVYIPVLIIACFIAVIYFMHCLTRSLKLSILFATMWCVSLSIVFAQGEFFVYQYFVLVLPALVTFVLWERMK